MNSDYYVAHISQIRVLDPDFTSVMLMTREDDPQLKKENDNQYDDEAILAYDKRDSKSGYVANSVDTVARGTYSAGRLYDTFEQECECVVRFMMDDCLIAEIVDDVILEENVDESGTDKN